VALPASPTREFVTGLPKAELHLHLEGTLEPDLKLELARRNGVELAQSTVEEVQASYVFDSLASFLAVYYPAMDVLVTEQDFYDLATAYLRRAAADGVTHVEATAKRPEVPLAVVIGPRGVHDLEVDTDALAERHDVTVLGRKRTPSLLVRFSDPDQGLWAQLVAFAHDLGVDRLAAAAGLGKD